MIINRIVQIVCVNDALVALTEGGDIFIGDVRRNLVGFDPIAWSRVNNPMVRLPADASPAASSDSPEAERTK